MIREPGIAADYETVKTWCLCGPMSPRLHDDGGSTEVYRCSVYLALVSMAQRLL
jgi:hypothetical protein